MNERIKELASDCETTYIDRDGRTYIEFDKEKFAELIVRECVGILHERENNMCNQSNNHIRAIRSDECHIMADCVLKHFGVEE